MNPLSQFIQSQARWVIRTRQTILFVLLIGVLRLFYVYDPAFRDGLRDARELAQDVAIAASDMLVSYYHGRLHLSENAELAPSATSFSYGPMIASVIGGKGEGLDCSIPPVGEFFFDIEDGDANISLKFRQACVSHDLCYRHGLATYGYTKQICDQNFLEAAVRLCSYWPNPIPGGAIAQAGSDTRATRREAASLFTLRVSAASSSQVADARALIAQRKELARRNCVAMAKKALLGVQAGGAKAYKGWSETTYFEYDTLPRHSEQFISARVIPDIRPRREAPERMVTLIGRPTGLREPDRRLLELPPNHLPASPVAVGQGLHFVQRQELDNTVVSLTSLPPGGSGKPDLVPGVDLLSSSPIIMPRAEKERRPRLLGVTAQQFQRLSAKILVPDDPCRESKASDLRLFRPTLDHDLYILPSLPEDDTDLRYHRARFFQQAPIAGPLALPGGSSADAVVLVHGRNHDGSRMSSLDYRRKADILVLDMTRARKLPNCLFALQSRFLRDVPITEKHQPLSLLATAGGNGLIGMRRLGGELVLHELFLDTLDPAPAERPTSLHESFADRPPLVLNPGADGPGTDASLLLSRARVTASDMLTKMEMVRIDLVLIQRGAQRWGLTRAASCEVTYRIERANPVGDCGLLPPRLRLNREVDADHEAASAGNQLRGAQIVAGRLSQTGQLSVALIDKCHRNAPLVLGATPRRENEIGSFTPLRAVSSQDRGRNVRSVTCWSPSPACLVTRGNDDDGQAGSVCAPPV